MLLKNPWSEYKRQNPASAASIGQAGLHVLFVIFMVGFTYYALGCKPFQSVSFGGQPVVLPEHQHGILPLPMPAHINLTAPVHQQVAARKTTHI
jgi:hypothetical protein